MPHSFFPNAKPNQYLLANTSDQTDSNSNQIRQYLRTQMIRSKRLGYWFRLGMPERSLYSLALQLPVKFKSIVLVRALVSILKELKQCGDRTYNTLMRGSEAAWMFSIAAVSWGNAQAQGWRNDHAYIVFLGRMAG